MFGHPALAAGLPAGRARARAPGPRASCARPAWQLDVRAGRRLARWAGAGAAVRAAGRRPGGAGRRARDRDPRRAAAWAARRRWRWRWPARWARAPAPGRPTWRRRSPPARRCSTAAPRASTPRPPATAASGCSAKGEGWRPAAVRQPLKLCVGLSGSRARTGDLVEAVAHLCRRTPAARRLIDELGELSRAGLEALAVGDIDGAGAAVRSGPRDAGRAAAVDAGAGALVHGARAAGAIGAKLTGAGGGGAVIALAPSHRDGRAPRWRDDGFQALEARIEGGVRPARWRRRCHERAGSPARGRAPTSPW